MRASAALALAAAAFLAGCGGGGGGSPATTSAGGARELYVGQCGACHTLRDAGTEGVAGKNLDDLRPSRTAVLKAIREGPKTMPAGLLAGADAQRVAAYVARVAGR